MADFIVKDEDDLETNRQTDSECQDKTKMEEIFPGDKKGSSAQLTESTESLSSKSNEENKKRSKLFQEEQQDYVPEEILDFHSLDLTKDTTDITSDFLTLPHKLSGRSSPSVLHRLRQFLNPDSGLVHQSGPFRRSNSDSKLGNHSHHSSRLEHRYSYDSRVDCSIPSSQDISQMLRDSVNPSNTYNNSQNAKSTKIFPEIPVDVPKMGFSDVSIVIDSHDQEDRGENEPISNIPDILVCNNDEDQDPNLCSQGVWIGLEAQTKTLLSPRSSNGSICSFRSSNADSAIEMLTPEEEMSDMHDFSCHQEAWDNDLIDSRSDKSQLHSHHELHFDKSQDFNFGGTLSQSQNFSLEKSELSEVWRQVMFNKSKSSQPKLCNEQSPVLVSSDHVNITKQPPSVVVSDYSTSTTEDKGSQTEAEASLQDQLDIMDKKYFSFNRSFSNSSISSTDTSLSFQSDSSQDVDDVQEPTKKQSSWKKIRNIVHWSPFIQQFKRRRYPWIQLAGHQGNFHAGEQPGAILKKFDSRECKSFHKLMKDVLRPYVPEFRGEAIKDGEWFIQLQDLLCEFEAPCVMDIKMGCRTYLEEELTKAREKPTLRKDMYQKMLEVDPSAPTAEEHNQKAITKPRYMQWRDEQSSSVELGFRIEGIRKSDGANIKNFKTTKQKSCIKDTFRQFVSDNDAVMNTYLRRLKSIQATQEVSPFFKSHEIIGSSLLFVHDKSGQASIWMIDFGKTVPLPDSVTVDHKSVWVEGNHEDGYLSGVSNLIEIFEDLVKDKHENSKGCNSKSVSDSPNEIRNVCDSGKVTESEHKNPETVSNVDNDSKKPETNEHSTEETPSASDVKHKESSC